MIHLSICAATRMALSIVFAVYRKSTATNDSIIRFQDGNKTIKVSAALFAIFYGAMYEHVGGG